MPTAYRPTFVPPSSSQLFSASLSKDPPLSPHDPGPASVSRSDYLHSPVLISLQLQSPTRRQTCCQGPLDLPGLCADRFDEAIKPSVETAPPIGAHPGLNDHDLFCVFLTPQESRAASSFRCFSHWTLQGSSLASGVPVVGDVGGCWWCWCVCVCVCLFVCLCVCVCVCVCV